MTSTPEARDQCPRCIAIEGLARLRALNAGRDVPGYVLHGKPLNYPAQAGVGEALLEQVVQAGRPCRAHGGRARR